MQLFVVVWWYSCSSQLCPNAFPAVLRIAPKAPMTIDVALASIIIVILSCEAFFLQEPFFTGKTCMTGRVFWSPLKLGSALQVTVYFSSVFGAKKETILLAICPTEGHLSRVNPFRKVNGKVPIRSIAGKAFVNTATIKGGQSSKGCFLSPCHAVPVDD